MARGRIEQQLSELARRRSHVESELAVAEEQLAHLAQDSEEARLRALVSETPLADRDYRDAERHTAAMRRHRDDLAGELRRLGTAQDELLDRYMSERG